MDQDYEVISFIHDIYIDKFICLSLIYCIFLLNKAISAKVIFLNLEVYFSIFPWKMINYDYEW